MFKLPRLSTREVVSLGKLGTVNANLKRITFEDSHTKG